MISRLATTEMNIEACNIITPCNPVDSYKSFRTIHCHFQNTVKLRNT